MDNRPVILCGLGHVGRRVLDFLIAAKLPAVVVDLRPDDVPAGVTAITGDFSRPAVLEQAGVKSARSVIVCTSDDLLNVSVALAIRRQAPDVRVIVRMFNPALVKRLGTAAGELHALSVSALAAPLLALIARTGASLGAFAAADGPRAVAEINVDASSPFAGKPLVEAAARAGVIVLARMPFGDPSKHLLNVPADEPAVAGDRLVVCGPPREIARLKETRGDAGNVRMAGWLRRTLRVVRRTLNEFDWPVKICAAVFFAVVAAGAIAFRVAQDDSLASALAHTIGVMTTAGDLHADAIKYDWMKVFVAGLRIVGAALFAAFTAIVTNSLFRARLGGALEIRRIPEGGHIVVCGLGNVGYRVAEELLRAGERLVVLEPNRDNRFLTTARRLGAAVLTGDATVGEVLRQARVDSARAVVAATGNDLVNLEIALLARELNPEKRVVVRLTDPQLADTLRSAAHVQLAVSVPMLAAPAFVAALYGDRVQGVFLVAGKLLAAVEFTFDDDSIMGVGDTIRAVAIDLNLLPVGVVAANAQPVLNPWDHRLAVGDRLTAIVELDALDRLYRREPPAKEWSVEVTAFPLTARADLALMLRSAKKWTADQAESALNALPLRLKSELSRGQAEELRALLTRERVNVRVVRDGVTTA